jgi:glycine/D-amino acid oxidase-like deaminating enzyme
MLTTRRQFLHRALLAMLPFAASGGLAGCLRRASTLPSAALAPDNLPLDTSYLPPVHVSADREIRTVVGLRPFRASGFRIERETLGATTIVHNYGHGGGGITLSWGTAKLACDLGLQGYVGEVAVIGCGVVGLTTARLAQEAGFNVTIYTKAMPPETTSNIAGGQWKPTSVYADSGKLTPAFTQQFIAASRYAYERTQILAGPRYGVRWMRNYQLYDEPQPDVVDRVQHPVLPPVTAGDARDALMPEHRVLTAAQNPFPVPLAVQFDSLIMEPPIYLAALLADVQLAGGRVVVREFQTPAELQALPQKLVFNCTGLGAKALFNDAELTPIKGQLTFLVPQPEVTYATLYGETYMFSRTDGVLLGGTFARGDSSLTVDEAAKARILAAQAKLFNGMRKRRA